MTSLLDQLYVRSAIVKREEVENPDTYPFSIPALRHLEELKFKERVTYFVGDNGSGKSTLLEGIAVAAGFNPEGGTRNFSFSTRASHSPLHQYLRLVKSPLRWRDGFFLRAESYFNVATNIEELDKGGGGPPLIDSYGGTYLHDLSHGESFLALLKHRLGGNGLYIFDEPEAALSPTRQLAMLSIMHRLVQANSQFIIATHSPILMAYPGAAIYHFDSSGIEPCAYEDTEHYLVTRHVLENPAEYMAELFE